MYTYKNKYVYFNKKKTKHILIYIYHIYSNSLKHAYKLSNSIRLFFGKTKLYE